MSRFNIIAHLYQNILLSLQIEIEQSSEDIHLERFNNKVNALQKSKYFYRYGTCFKVNFTRRL